MYLSQVKDARRRTPSNCLLPQLAMRVTRCLAPQQWRLPLMCAATDWLREATWSAACEMASGLDATRRVGNDMLAPLPAANMDEAVEPPGAASAATYMRSPQGMAH